ncbi:MAG: nucleotidyltransferase domain-containing protein, partial [Pseudomonadota bacterium]
MTTLAFQPAIADDMRAAIMEKLAGIEANHDVRILFAIESGSRAWGFPSPDSDYDVRFVYAHAQDWYLALKPGRDVIELPISDDLDIGGWDLRKALNLLLKPNPVMLEWLSSPIRYIWNDNAAQALIAFAEKTAHAHACVHHYLHLGDSQWRKHIADNTTVNYKKYFYVLRPAMAIRWVRLNPDTPPPMNIQSMSEHLNLDAETVDDIARLLQLKSEARETGEGARIGRLDDLIQSELAWARDQKERPQGMTSNRKPTLCFCA